MRKGIRALAAVALLLVLCPGSAVFAASPDARDVGLFPRLLALALGRLFPPIGAPAPNGRLSPPGGSPLPNSRLFPPTGAPTP